MFLVNSRLGHFTATSFRSGSKSHHVTEALLIPKLRSYFAEFLNKGSLKRLRILSSPTCVGLRYGHRSHSLEAFLGSVESESWLVRRLASPLPSELTASRIYLGSPPTVAAIHFQSDVSLSFCVPPSLKCDFSGAGILTCCPSPTLFSLGLGPTNPGRINLPQETLGFRREGFSPSFSLLMPAYSLPWPDTSPLGLACICQRMLPYRSTEPRRVQCIP